MSLKAKLVLPLKSGVWVQEWELSIPPFPGLGIRIDVYDMVNVDSVVVGDSGFDVTCICSPEPTGGFTDKQLAALGFEIAPYP